MCKAYKYCFILLIAVITNSCSNNSNQNDNGISTDVVNNPKTASTDAKNDGTLPQIQFEIEHHDFGNITEGEKVEYNFKFKNTGTADLIISSAKASCGCTIPIWPKEPIPPGGEGIIKVSYNSEGRPGKVDKKITIVSNTNPNTKILTIGGKVLEAKNKESE